MILSNDYFREFEQFSTFKSALPVGKAGRNIVETTSEHVVESTSKKGLNGMDVERSRLFRRMVIDIV